MELTIDQALQNAISAHKEGKLQEAERFYRAILQSQPQHSDANHNLGLLAVSLNKVEQSLPYFTNALKSNPKPHQYWLSYIDALIKLGRLDEAKQALTEGKGYGLSKDQSDKLEAQIDSINLSLSDAVNSLIALYNQGKLQEALNRGVYFAQQFPDDPNIPNLMGAINAGLGRLEEATTSYNKAVELNPNFA